MRTAIIISLLCISVTASHAQTNDFRSTEHHQLITNGKMGHHIGKHHRSSYSQVHTAYPYAPVNAVPAWPTNDQYTAVVNPPCYKYSNQRGHEVMECPGARFQPEHPELNVTNETAMNNEVQKNDNWNVVNERTYTGNYPRVQSLYPEAPANAVAAWPVSPYTQLKNPPCYEYVNNRGHKVMECPGARFEPEADNR